MPAKMKIRSAYATLPSAERKVADFILENPDRATRMVINEIAEAAGVSVPSVTRLARKLGYNGFLDFRVALASGTANMDAQRDTTILPEDSEETVIDKIYSASVNALEDTYKALDKQSLISLAHKLEVSERIFLCGAGGTSLLVGDIMSQMLSIGLQAGAVLTPEAISAYGKTFREGDIVIVVSRTGRNKMLNEALKMAKKKGATTALLCNYVNAPCAQIVDHFFCTSRLDDYKTIMGRETNSTMISILNLLVLLVARNIKQKQEA